MIEDLVGLSGMILLVAAFLLNLLGKLRASTLGYKLLNVFGAGILAWYGFAKETYIFVALEGFWALASVYAIVKPGPEDSSSH